MELNGIVLVEDPPGTWTMRRIADGEAESATVAVLTAEPGGFRVSHPDKGDDYPTLLLPGDIETVAKKVAAAVAEASAGNYGVMNEYFFMTQQNLNVLASKTDQMPAFLNSLAKILADTLHEDIAPEKYVTALQIFGDQVQRRLAKRGAESGLSDAVRTLMSKLIAEIGQGKADDEGGPTGPTH